MKKRRRQVTLKDIATACGVSVPSVSGILNKRESNYCSEKVRQRVLETAKQLNYRRHFGYTLLQGQSTRTVALLPSMERLTHEEHIRDLLLLLTQTLESKDYYCYTSIFKNNLKENSDIVENLINRGCEALVFIGNPVGFEELEKLCIKNGLNYLFVLSHLTKRDIQLNVKNAFIAFLKHFIANGHDDFKFILYPGGSTSRFDALRELVPDKSLEELQNKYIVYIDREDAYTGGVSLEERINDGYGATRKLLEKFPGIKAVAYYSDYTFLGGAKALMEKGLIPGRDVMISGFNNILSIRSGVFNISTGSHNIRKICQETMDHLFDEGDLKIQIEPEIMLY